MTVYSLMISAGQGSGVTVRRGGQTIGSGTELSSGDVLQIEFAAEPGYELLSHTVNGVSFPSGGTHTVTGAVQIVAAARRRAPVRVDTGSAFRRGRLLLDTGLTYRPLRLFVDRGGSYSEV